MIQLLVTDLDGTLVNDDHNTVSAENAAALNTMRQNGTRIAIATGRTHSISANVLAQIPCDYAVLSNGAAIIDLASGARIHQDTIPHDQAMRVFSLLEKNESVFSFFCDGNVYMEERRREIFCDAIGNKLFSGRLLTGMTFVPHLPAAIAGRDIEKIDINCLSAAERAALARKLQETGDFTFSNSFGKNIEMNAAGVTKGKALRRLCETLNIPAAAVMAFGDSDNDTDMLRWAGYSFAMENAAADIKAAAKYRAPPNTQSGVAKAIEAHLRRNISCAAGNAD
jgi:Cof subfamily protein (haloacid dehalogenase superfamily)